MKPKCHICNSLSDYLLQKSGYDLYKCYRCGLIFVHPLPPKKDFQKIYSIKSGYQTNKLKDLTKAIEDKKTLKILSYLSKVKKGKLLDVGCSNGEFMYFAKKRGYEVFGVELNPETAKIAKANKLKVFHGILEQAKFKKESFGIIFLGDIIEHVSTPGDFLKKCLKILKKNGLLIISTPNMDCFWVESTYLLYRFLKIPMSVITPPYHLYQFSLENLNILANQSGLKEKKYWYNPPPKLFHELYQTELAQKYYRNKSLQNRIWQYFGFFLYTFCWILNKVISKIDGKDFSMLVIYQKKR